MSAALEYARINSWDVADGVYADLLKDDLAIRRPERIELRSNLLFGLVEGALKEAWCKPVLVEEMPMMDEAIDSLMDHLNSPS